MPIIKQIIIASIITGLWPVLTYAQQKPQYTQYVINNYLLNPAISGIEDYADIKLGSRAQWVGIKGAPVTFYLTGHTKLGKSKASNALHASENKPGGFAVDPENFGRYRKVKAHHGIGGILLHDKIGPFSRTEVSGSYAYHVPLTAALRLATGISAGFISQSFRSNEVTFANPADNASAGWSRFSPNISVGLWLYAKDFYLGASSTQLGANAFSSGDVKANSSKYYNHYFVTTAYKIAPTPNVAFIPSVLVKWVQPAVISLDYNLRLLYADQYWLGLSYRQSESYAVTAGFYLNHKLEISYAYDFGQNSLSSSSSGSHEVVLGLRLSNVKKIICPQNLW